MKFAINTYKVVSMTDKLVILDSWKKTSMPTILIKNKSGSRVTPNKTLKRKADVFTVENNILFGIHR